ncbi:hypothetical protein Tco_1220513 [Tanacetum coccineum]
MVTSTIRHGKVTQTLGGDNPKIPRGDKEEGQISSKNVNSISLARGEEERNNDNDVATCDDIEKPTRTETGMPVNEAENGIKNEPIRKAKKEETTKAPNFMQ